MALKPVGIEDDETFPGRVGTAVDKYAITSDLRVNNLGALLAGYGVRKVQPVGIVFVGSSTTEGSDQSPGDRWVNKLVYRLQSAVPTNTFSAVGTLSSTKNTTPGIHGYNGGLSGTTSINYLTDAKVTQIGGLDPRAIIHMVGSNDYKNGITPANYRANMVSWLDKLDAAVTNPHVHVLAHGQERTDGPFTYPYTEYRQVLLDLAQERSNCTFIDTSPYFVAAGNTGTDPLDIMKPDGVHLTVQGHTMMFHVMEREMRIPAPPMTSAGTMTQHILISDDFNSGNIADINGQALNGNMGGRMDFSWVCDPIAYVGRTSGYMMRNGTGTGAWVVGTRIWHQNMEMSFRLRAMPTGASLTAVVRRAAATIANTPNDIRLHIGVDGSLDFQKRFNTTPTSFGTAPAGTVVAGDRIAIRAYEDLLRVLVNDVVVLSAIDTSIIASGYCGFSGVGAATSWQVDDLVIAIPVN